MYCCAAFVVLLFFTTLTLFFQLTSLRAYREAFYDRLSDWLSWGGSKQSEAGALHLLYNRITTCVSTDWDITTYILYIYQWLVYSCLTHVYTRVYSTLAGKYHYLYSALNCYMIMLKMKLLLVLRTATSIQWRPLCQVVSLVILNQAPSREGNFSYTYLLGQAAFRACLCIVYRVMQDRLTGKSKMYDSPHNHCPMN